jgi:type II secretory pathway pseudopilin PulG
MEKVRKQIYEPSFGDKKMHKESGFALTEFLISTVVILVLSAGLFTMLTDVQSTAGYQTEVLNVMENTRTAMNIIGRDIMQVGNNPRSAVFTPIPMASATQVQICADLTGLAGGSQGDPDGDVLDENEDIIIRHNQSNRSIELVAANGTVQTLADHISGLTLQYLDADGNTTTVPANVRLIRVSISGSSTVANPRTRKTFGLTITGDFTLPNLG